jgi:hypothetical protein
MSYCAFSNPELHKVIYRVTSYGNTYNIYKIECVRPVKKISQYVLTDDSSLTGY